jgi:hypothetical protein
MQQRVERRTVDLSTYPDLVVIYLGMRLNRLAGIRQFIKLGPQIQRAVDDRPAGLLLHENVIWGLIPPHVGMRQYWRDFESLESWARTLPHQRWWHDFLRDTGGTGFWHETYFRRGGFEAIYDDLAGLGGPPGLARFAPIVPAEGRMFSARDRLVPAAEAPGQTSPPTATD